MAGGTTLCRRSIQRSDSITPKEIPISENSVGRSLTDVWEQGLGGLGHREHTWKFTSSLSRHGRVRVLRLWEETGKLVPRKYPNLARFGVTSLILICRRHWSDLMLSEVQGLSFYTTVLSFWGIMTGLYTSESDWTICSLICRRWGQFLRMQHKNSMGEQKIVTYGLKLTSLKIDDEFIKDKWYWISSKDALLFTRRSTNILGFS